MVEIYPVIKVNEPSISYIWQGLPLDCLVVRLQDLISPFTFEFNNVFYKIKEANGIHNFLGFNGKIILSLVMKDVFIHQFDEDRYAEVINTLKPDFYTTVDGETYEGEIETSKQEIKRCFIETAKLITLCPNSKPIGQVKGCSKHHLLCHIHLLKSIGINDFIFHVGDFFRNGEPIMRQLAKEYALLIRKYADTLILYGMGSQKRLLEFSFADAYITFNYFVKAINGKKYARVNKMDYLGGYSPSIVKHNLIEMIKNVANIKKQKKLIEGGVCLWEEVKEEQEQLMLKAEVIKAQVI